MRRLLLTAAAGILATLALAGPAAAHPLGNFSQNHQTRVTVSAGRLDLHYILDQAEIPTFQQRGERPAQVLAGVRAQVARFVTARVDGRPLPLTLAPGGLISFPPGQGGLHTTRVELALSAPLGSPSAAIDVRDGTFPGRVGWKAVIVAPGSGTAVRSSVPQGDPTTRSRASGGSGRSCRADARPPARRGGARWPRTRRRAAGRAS